MSIKILTICPSKRPEMLADMAASFKATIRENNELIIDDRLGPTVTQIINDVWLKNPGYDFYHITNDDVLYHTKGWDTEFVRVAEQYGHGIFYGNDLFMGEKLPTFPFISKEIALFTGYLQEPSLIRYYGDTVWQALGRATHCLYYLPHVIIEHRTFFNGKRDGQVDMDAYNKDTESFHKWGQTRAILDIAKVKGALDGKG